MTCFGKESKFWSYHLRQAVYSDILPRPVLCSLPISVNSRSILYPAFSISGGLSSDYIQLLVHSSVAAGLPAATLAPMPLALFTMASGILLCPSYLEHLMVFYTAQENSLITMTCMAPCAQDSSQPLILVHNHFPLPCICRDLLALCVIGITCATLSLLFFLPFLTSISSAHLKTTFLTTLKK